MAPTQQEEGLAFLAGGRGRSHLEMPPGGRGVRGGLREGPQLQGRAGRWGLGAEAGPQPRCDLPQPPLCGYQRSSDLTLRDEGKLSTRRAALWRARAEATVVRREGETGQRCESKPAGLTKAWGEAHRGDRAGCSMRAVLGPHGEGAQTLPSGVSFPNSPRDQPALYCGPACPQQTPPPPPLCFQASLTCALAWGVKVGGCGTFVYEIPSLQHPGFRQAGMR